MIELNTDSLRRVHGKFMTGVTVVTTHDEEVPRGLTLNAFSSLTLDPPLIMVAVQTNSASYEALFRSKHFAVNILASDQADLALSFASKRADKFEGISWSPGPFGSPLLEGVAAWIEAETSERIRMGSHSMFIGQVCQLEYSDQPPLIYGGGRFYDGSDLMLAEGTK